MVVLIVLGGLLIYSLLLSNVEEKTYEYGMLRAMGMKQYVLIELLVSQVFILSTYTVSFLFYSSDSLRITYFISYIYSCWDFHL